MAGGPYWCRDGKMMMRMEITQKLNPDRFLPRLSKNSNGNWMQVQKITATDRFIEDHFGYSVSAMHGNILVGALSEDEDANGGTYP